MRSGSFAAHAKLAESIVADSGVSQGYALIVGERDSRLAAALAARTDLHVISLLTGEERVAKERERLLTTKLYGSRVVVDAVDDLSRLPYGPYFADLVIVSDRANGLSGKELYRVLRPCGGIMWFCGLAEPAAEELAEPSRRTVSLVRWRRSQPLASST